MPRGDATGPVGMGPMSGRAAGICAGYPAPGYANPGFGRGAGFGRGKNPGGFEDGFNRGGRGWRRMGWTPGRPGWMRCGVWPAPVRNSDPGVEKQALKNQADALQAELDFIRKRISEIEAGIPSE